MEALFDVLDYFTYGIAIVGGLLAILWIFNSTIKERRGVERRAARVRNPAFERILTQGALLQRLGFSTASVATGVAILWFARGYYNKYHVNVATAYFYVAAVLIGIGAIGVILCLLFRNKE